MTAAIRTRRILFYFSIVLSPVRATTIILFYLSTHRIVSCAYRKLWQTNYIFFLFIIYTYIIYYFYNYLKIFKMTYDDHVYGDIAAIYVCYGIVD